MSIRPSASLDYYRLTEDAHQETGGGDAIDLFVEKRRSDELALNAGLAMARDFGEVEDGIGRPRIEIEGGRRQILSGDLGATIASFKNGNSFTLTPEDRSSGWTGAARFVGGGKGFRIGGEVNADGKIGLLHWRPNTKDRVPHVEQDRQCRGAGKSACNTQIEQQIICVIKLACFPSTNFDCDWEGAAQLSCPMIVDSFRAALV